MGTASRKGLPTRKVVLAIGLPGAGKSTYFARRGYVSARVDIRGFGASEGTPPDREYSAQLLLVLCDAPCHLSSNSSTSPKTIAWEM